jgi:Fe-S cluster biogenesis protein NfuA
MTQAWDDPPPAREIVESWLDRVRPALVADGGNIELVGIDADGTVRVSMQGTCTECPAQLATLRVGIEDPLKKAVRGIRAVVVIND